jgi:hypothetical protein
MSRAVGLLSNRVKKVPSTQVDQNRYTFLSLEDSEPDLGVPPQEGNLLLSTLTGQRKWSNDILYNQSTNALQLHNSYELTGNTAVLQTQTETVISSFSIFNYGSAKFLIQVIDQLTNERQVSELLVIHNEITASATEYSLLYTGNQLLASYDVDIEDDEVFVLATAQTENTLEYKICEILMLS